MNSALLINIKRSDLVERQHSGFIVLVDKDEHVLSQVGNPENLDVFLRSCAKPFQALPVITSKAFEKFNLSSQEIALCSASHSAEDQHLKIVKGILKKIGLDEENLQCGADQPLDQEVKDQLLINNLKPSQLHNNCSGKHSGMLSVCVNNDWDINGYLDFNHPLQVKILNYIKKYCNITGDIPSSLDNCSAPVYGIPLHKMGAGYLRLFLSNEGEAIKNAFVQNPYLIGGTGRLDSIIMDLSKGRLIAKTGAEGLCIITNLKENLSLVVKMMNSDNLVRSLVIVEALKQLGWLSSKELENDIITPWTNIEIKTLRNKVVGKKEILFKVS